MNRRFGCSQLFRQFLQAHFFFRQHFDQTQPVLVSQRF